MRSLPHTVAVIGLGLMGGSLARALVSRGVTLLAHDADPAVLSAADADGVVDGSLGPDLARVDTAEIIVIATPVDAATEVLEAIAPHLSPTAVVTDVGSAKRSICDRAVELGIGARFVGSHPLAGDHRSGWSASRVGLYDGTHVYLCATVESAPFAMERVASFWSALGAKAEVVDVAEHDRRMAWVSHLPQVASSAVAAAMTQSGCTPHDLGPGGRDVMRLAASSPEMWSAICLANADNLVVGLAHLQERLSGFRTALDRGDRSALVEFFREGRNWVS